VAHVSLYRKYRSQTFDELVGQDHVVKTLRNGLSSGRTSHAYLFTGPRGTGKTSTARLLAKCLCAEDGPTANPDPESHICLSIAAGTCVDVVEMDAASESGVDDIRTAIVEAVEYKPMMCRYKVFIIDEVHDLSSKAFDALLKTIEEPPPHVVFILATTEFSKVPATIKSRCQKFEFHRGSLSDLSARLEFVAKSEGVEIEPAALAAIARMADGAFRDALSLLEQVMLSSEGKITLVQVQDQLGLVSDELIDRLLVAIAVGAVAEIMTVMDIIARTGRDPRATLDSMLYRLQDLTRAAYKVDEGGIGDASQEAALHETASRLGPERLLAIRSMAADASRAIRDVSLPRIWLESRLVTEATQDPELVRKSPAVAKAVVKAPEPTPTPTPKPAPAPAPPKVAETSQATSKVEAPEVPAAPVEPEADADPALAPGVEAWAKLIAAMPEVPARFKLQASVVEGLTGNKIVVGIPLRINLDWFTENPKRIGYVQSQLRASAGDEWSFELRPAKKNGRRLAQHDQAVELPAEGQALHEKVVAVFRT
jgi:DNA polymerase-3 subunit gamma/tau